jgi:hypothetical protein
VNQTETEAPGISGNDDAFFEAYQEATKDITKPDGEACRPDGTLKDVTEMEWRHSPTDSDNNEQEQMERASASKRKLPSDEADSESEKLRRAKVNRL